MNARITQSYWNPYRVAPTKAADKPRRERPTFAQILKAQVKSDPITITFETLAVFFGAATIISQILIAIGRIQGQGWL